MIDTISPPRAKKLSMPLTSPDRREAFLLDVSRGRIDLAKVTFQNRARQIVVLLRLDLAGAPHRNPDDEEVPCPHLHIYREGFGHKWAVPAPPEMCPGSHDAMRAYDAFLVRCNVTSAPLLQLGLF